MSDLTTLFINVYWILTLCGTYVLAGREICDRYGSTYTYCDDGYYCCDNNTRCCAETVSAGAIIGIVLASIFVIAICIACAAILAKKKHKSGMLVHPPNRSSAVNTISTNQTSIYPTGPQQGGFYWPGMYSTQTTGQGSQQPHPPGSSANPGPPVPPGPGVPPPPPPYTQNLYPDYPPPEYKREPDS